MCVSCDAMDYSLPGSSVHVILQAGILEWAVQSLLQGSSWPKDCTQVSCVAGRFFTIWTTREAHCVYVLQLLCPLICQGTSGLLPCSDYYKWCCGELWGICGLFESWFSQSICPVMGLLGHMVFFFYEIFILFSIVTVSIYIPTNCAERFSFLHSLSSISCLWVFWWGPSWLVWGIPHCCLNLHFSNNEQCWASFHVCVGHLCIFSGEMSI